MASLFQGAVADQVPYGIYDVEFSVPSSVVIRRQVHVFQPDVWVFSGALGHLGDREYSAPGDIVSGKVTNIPAYERPVFMTMSGVTAPYMVNSIVTDEGNGSGTFRFVADNPMSVFMLFTIGKSGILDAREFQLPGVSAINIDLSHPNPPKIEAPSGSRAGGQTSTDDAIESQVLHESTHSKD